MTESPHGHKENDGDYYGQSFDAFFSYLLARTRLELCLRRDKTPAEKLGDNTDIKKLCSRLNRYREHSMKFR